MVRHSSLSEPFTINQFRGGIFMKHRSDNNREMPPGEKINATTFDRRKFMASVGLMAGALAAPALLQNRVQANESGANHGLPGTNSISKKPKPSVGIEWYNVKDYQVKGDGQTNDAPALLNLLKGLTGHEAAHGLKIEETCYDFAYGYQIGTVQNYSALF